MIKKIADKILFWAIEHSPTWGIGFSVKDWNIEEENGYIYLINIKKKPKSPDYISFYADDEKYMCIKNE